MKAGRYWYATFRSASLINMMVALVWTALMVIPVAPFSEVPRLLVDEPGEWLLVGYLIFVSVGGGAFGWLSGLLSQIEKGEGRTVSSSLMWPGFALFYFGVVASCALLGYAGAAGGFAYMNGGTSLQHMLTQYVYPITSTALAGVVGAMLVLLAMIRAKGP